MKKLISSLLLVFLLSSCYTIHTYDGRKTYRVFFNPSVKHEYCKDKETILKNAEYYYRKIFGKSKDYYLLKTMVREDSCCFYIHYYGYPDAPEGYERVGKDNREITLSKEKCKILNWH
jgi:hypothetical protein